MNKFAILEEAANAADGCVRELWPMRSIMIEQFQILHSEGLLEGVQVDGYQVTYRITEAGRAFVKANEIPAAWY
jgi:hypothetical protein